MYFKTKHTFNIYLHTKGWIFKPDSMAFPTLLQFASYLDWDHCSLHHVPEASN